MEEGIEDRHCIIHITDSEENFVKVNKKSWETINQYAKKWQGMDFSVREKEVADQILQTQFKDNLYYHRQCYGRFADKTKVERAEKRKEAENQRNNFVISSNDLEEESYGNLCHKFEANNAGTVQVTEILDLKSDHEEADTKIILHSLNAAKTHDRIIINSPDTDVFVLAISKLSDCNNVFFMTKKEKLYKFLDVTAIRSQIGEQAAAALLGLHCFSGTDCTSAFRGRGKVLPYKTMISDPEFVHAFEQLGDEFKFDKYLKIYEKFVCQMYGITCESVNDGRYQLFRKKISTDEALPPTRDALVQHVKRSNYCCAIWKRSCQQNIDAPKASEEYGWCVTEDGISPIWSTNDSAPTHLLKNKDCRCKTACSTMRCSCKKMKIACTELCACMNCQNNENPDGFSDSDTDSDFD